MTIFQLNNYKISFSKSYFLMKKLREQKNTSRLNGTTITVKNYNLTALTADYVKEKKNKNTIYYKYQC